MSFDAVCTITEVDDIFLLQQPDPLPPLNPLYDNRGFVPEESPRGFITDEPQEVQYAKVQKTFIDTRPQEPIPEPEITGPESIDAVIRDNEGDSDSSSSNSSPMSSPRQPIEEEIVDDFRIETEVVEQ